MNELLSRLGWSKAFLARRLEVSETTVGKWCRKDPPRTVMLYLELIDRLINEI